MFNADLWYPPAMYYLLYPFLTLHTYYPNPTLHQNFMHISSCPLQFSPVLYGAMSLLSASQSHVLTIRGSPPPFPICQLDSNINPWALPFIHHSSPIVSPLSSLQFPQPFYLLTMTSINSLCMPIKLPQQIPHNSILFSPHPESILHTTHKVLPAHNPVLPVHDPLSLDSPATSKILHL
jgi:hypothetical protein